MKSGSLKLLEPPGPVQACHGIALLLLIFVALVVAAKEIGLEVNADKTQYMVTSRDQNAGRTHSMKIDNNSFERVDEFKYLGTTLTL